MLNSLLSLVISQKSFLFCLAVTCHVIDSERCKTQSCIDVISLDYLNLPDIKSDDPESLFQLELGLTRLSLEPSLIFSMKTIFQQLFTESPDFTQINHAADPILN